MRVKTASFHVIGQDASARGVSVNENHWPDRRAVVTNQRLWSGLVFQPYRDVKRNVLPFPGSLSTHIRPPIFSTRRREMGSPSPVPPYCRAVDPSACTNGSKIFRT